MALLTGEDNKIYDSIIAAQAADTALSLDNIEASFAITRREKDEISISARSLGSVNVQVVMERLGGGGHLSNAATQLRDLSIEEAKAKLIKAIQNNDTEEE